MCKQRHRKIIKFAQYYTARKWLTDGRGELGEVSKEGTATRAPRPTPGEDISPNSSRLRLIELKMSSLHLKHPLCNPVAAACRATLSSEKLPEAKLTITTKEELVTTSSAWAGSACNYLVP